MHDPAIPQPRGNPKVPTRQQTKAERLMAEQELNLSTVVMREIQQQRVLWQTIRQFGGSVTVDMEKVDPLWDLKFEAIDKTKPNVVTMTAALLPEPTQEQLEKLASLLLGTSQNPINVQAQVGLPDHPTSYLVARMTPIVVFDGKKWLRRADYDSLHPQPPSHPENG